MGNHWYPKYTGDYKRGTSHLSLMQHGAYNLLLDHYYATEEPLPCLEQCMRITSAMLDEEKAAVKYVLEHFFMCQDDGRWINKRAEKVIEEQSDKKSKAKEKAEKAARARWGKDASSMPEALLVGKHKQCQPEPEPEPYLNLKSKSKPLGQKRKRFVPPVLDEVRSYISEQRYSVDPESFIDFYSSKGWMIGKNRMKDWKAAVRTWQRGNKEKNTTINTWGRERELK